MPIIKSAKKKLRADKKRQAFNSKLSHTLHLSIKKAKKTPSEKNINEAISIVDKNAKSKIIHKNKAARIKSQLSKLLTKKETLIKKRQKNSLQKNHKKVV